MSLTDILPFVVGILAFTMLLMALGISSAKTVKQMIQFYQTQSVILAVVTLLTAVEPDPVSGIPFARLNIAYLMFVPLLLFVTVEVLLARATVPDPSNQLSSATPTGWKRIYYWLRELRELPRQANPIWLEHGAPRRNQIHSLAFNLVLTIIAYIIASRLVGGSQPTQVGIDPHSLAVSIALLLVGLFTMSRKQDIISQIMGLLVMEHGMFLAAIKVITFPGLALIFVISLFLYIIITLTILVYLLPELHHTSGTIDIEDQQQLKG